MPLISVLDLQISSAPISNFPPRSIRALVIVAADAAPSRSQSETFLVSSTLRSAVDLEDSILVGIVARYAGHHLVIERKFDVCIVLHGVHGPEDGPGRLHQVRAHGMIPEIFRASMADSTVIVQGLDIKTHPLNSRHLHIWKRGVAKKANPGLYRANLINLVVGIHLFVALGCVAPQTELDTVDGAVPEEVGVSSAHRIPAFPALLQRGIMTRLTGDLAVSQRHRRGYLHRGSRLLTGGMNVVPGDFTIVATVTQHVDIAAEFQLRIVLVRCSGMAGNTHDILPVRIDPVRFGSKLEVVVPEHLCLSVLHGVRVMTADAGKPVLEERNVQVIPEIVRQIGERIDREVVPTVKGIVAEIAPVLDIRPQKLRQGKV